MSKENEKNKCRRLEKISASEALQMAVTEAEGIKGYICAAMTDEYLVDCWPSAHNLIGKADKLLDLRIFNPEKEVRLFRSYVGSDFYIRIAGPDCTGTDYYDEKQFLDIDWQVSEQSFQKSNLVFATGGGAYKLPLKNPLNAVLKVLNYPPFHR